MAERLVLDASIAIKWFLKDSLETNVAQAERIFLLFLNADIELYVPRIFTYEVCGALTKACGHRPAGTLTPRITMEYAKRCARELFQLPLQIEAPSEEEAIVSLEMAVKYSKGLYDMTYLRLAQRLNCQWCTADEKFLLAVPSGFPAKQIVLLSSY